ncbi:molybdate ABC transporter substrate-binding protein [Poseidonibacter ostreae]|jgi:molybdate transport system substrate-binding protein|uniref:Molybdate ABC transporter substrate-binding protein n=1 Tax=Poseidonibacter ostreae TaxID=2654171 RepID=A0A6L4WTE5_9BACT|nr:molybdate ABC transporter substrate-binding protein [Poseidonibacter ostreae]KAB7887074.1 molybdate ABC transporter substrate-binding protein [Poseidonibacter ostreae]KAB7889202.1 molybdate ABC transporter substrate-binding protein [Poseidonibacter ostreae]KAB7891597.1 molybdate ABC transporter substrate-binding protein [Poseidonibacter ostreae]MAC84804.1 molybdate ABC transporter substrate-binding protein [Arcobacter sp.]|tara:strand:+ start:672 stop:1427 length:756 start_codon:yes stop_codon:yes gene_type:complete
MFNKIVLVLLLLVLNINAKDITIAVAANVSYAINDLIKEFNIKNPNTKVNVILGSSGKLNAQISHGAPYDLFMSANMKYPYNLYKNNFANIEPKVYAKGSLAYFSTKNLDFSKDIKHLLEDKNIKQIAIANPKTAPYGIASFQALKNAKVFENIKSKFVYGESISQTISYSVSATDIGIIAKSSLFSNKMSKYKENINWKEIDSKLYTPIKQGVVLLNNAKNKEETQAFYNFIFSKKAKEIFKSYGYLINE